MAKVRIQGYDKFIRVNAREADRINLALERKLARDILEVRSDDLDALRTLGDVLTRLGSHEEALDVDRRIVKRAPDDAVGHYNLACSCSNLNMIDEALESLSSAIELGYREFDHLLRDPDLVNVRRDPRFRRLFKRHKTNLA